MADMPGWDRAVAAAEKVLGKDADIPKPKGTIDKAVANEGKQWGDFVKARESLEEEVLALVDASQQVAAAIEQFRDVISENAFGLDLKKKDDLKKIQEARKIMLALLDKHIATVRNNAKDERELNKHLANIGPTGRVRCSHRCGDTSHIAVSTLRRNRERASVNGRGRCAKRGAPILSLPGGRSPLNCRDFLRSRIL